MFKKYLLIVCFVFSQAVSRTIEPYDSKYKEQVLRIAFEKPELFLPGFGFLSKNVPNFSVNDFINQSKITFEQKLENKLVITFVAIDDKKIVGFISFFRAKEQSIEAIKEAFKRQAVDENEIKKAFPGIAETIKDAKEYILIESIAVTSSDWRKGHGKALLEHALEYITKKGLKAAYIQLHVDAENKNAQALYEKYEFKNVPSAMNAMGVNTMRREIK